MEALSKTIKTGFWGISVALAWTWGIGLFFSVQTAIQFGFKGLLIFATINAFGLTLFGLVNGYLAKQYASPEEFEKKFLARARNFRFAFLFYQFVAVTLTLFAVLKYVTFPLGILSILVCVMFVGATIFLGEEFKINRIKYSHAVMAVLIAVSLYVLLKANVWDAESGGILASVTGSGSNSLFEDLNYLAYLIPIAVGFMLGPWLDLQHWQRAIYIHKEKLSIAKSYIIGGFVFWAILIAHGSLAIAIFNKSTTIKTPIGLFDHVKDVITNHLSLNDPSLLGFYIVFICLAALATFDSAYVALKWYLKSLVKGSNNIVLSIIPQAIVVSPIPWFFLFAVSAVTTLHFTQIGKFIGNFDPSLVRFFQFELEYYMAFYASFFVMFAVTFIRTMMKSNREIEFAFLKLFSIGLCSLSIFGIGYFSENTFIMAFASVLPLVYGIFAFDKHTKHPEEEAEEEVIESKTQVMADTSSPSKLEIVPMSNYSLPGGAVPSTVQGCYVKDKWFVHSFIPTYQDTNSVGNVYFAMYAMWVGKTRELFFLHTMPEFDLESTDFYILTRSYEHKYVRETKEFDPISVHIKIKDHNRKFVTLEHEIYNSKQELLGKGSQSLMFVSSKDYSLIDVPQEMYLANAQFI